jgi:hypothetical protein
MTATTSAAAPTEVNGDKILFVVYDSTGVNTSALLRGIAVATQNAEEIAHLAVASHQSGDADGGTEPLVLAAGSDGSTVLHLLTDAAGRLAIATNAELGIVTETAPVSDTASSGLNGRLQRIAQRLSSLIALLPTALGGSGGLKAEGTGTAGTPAGGVVTVQGDGAGTALPVAVTGQPNVFKSLSAVNISSETTIWTPAGGKKFRLMGFVITQGTLTGDITLRDDTAGTTILVIPATPVGQPLSVSLGDGILSSTADHVLTATGVSTETISGFLLGREE